jgi:ABC-type Mn2+/Zn2+ transport system ATPase subunit
VTKPKLLVLDEPTEGIQPSIIKDIGRALVHLRRKGEMAISSSSNISNGPATFATITQSWIAASSCLAGRASRWTRRRCARA